MDWPCLKAYLIDLSTNRRAEAVSGPAPTAMHAGDLSPPQAPAASAAQPAPQQYSQQDSMAFLSTEAGVQYFAEHSNGQEALACINAMYVKGNLKGAATSSWKNKWQNCSKGKGTCDGKCKGKGKDC